MTFDWVSFCNKYGIPYNTRGPNTPRKGAISTHCKFCGAADQSDHLVLWPNGRWSCWRNSRHSGRHPTYAIQALLGCSLQEAAAIASSGQAQLATNLSKVAALLKPSPPSVRTLAMPKEFRPFANEWACQPYIQYLKDRPGGFKFEPHYLHWRYGIHYCLKGAFKGRIIFPVHHKGKLVSYTGRTIWPVSKLRYRTLTTDPDTAHKIGLEPALGPINNYLPWYDQLLTSTASTLILCEGFIDSLKINLLGNPEITSTCWLGAEPTNAQIGLLHTISHKFNLKLIFSDSDMPQKAYRIAWRLRALGFRAVALPSDLDDPAEFRSRAQLLTALQGLTG